MAIFDKKTEEKSGSASGGKTAAKKPSMKDVYAAQTAGTEVKAKTGADRKYGTAYKVLVKPLVTEKASVAGAANKYIFQVSSDANKVEVAKAIKEVYGIKPTKVNIVNVLGKKSRYGKAMGKRKDWKKAVVTLPEGQAIKVYEGV